MPITVDLAPSTPPMPPKTDVTANSYPVDHPISLRLARILQLILPRGKGAIPRYIGRYLLSRKNFSIKTARGPYLAVYAPSLDTYLGTISHGWDEHVLSICLALLSPGETFYDVGANIGYFSVCIAAHFCDTVHVVAFEPQPQLAKHIVFSMTLNRLFNFKIFDFILANENDRLPLYLASHSIWASLVPREKSSGVIWADSMKLDTVIERRSLLTPNLIKIDVEGAELDVIKGAKEMLRCARPIIVVECDSNSHRFGYEPGDIINELRDCDYTAFFALTKEINIIPLSEHPGIDELTGHNVVAFPSCHPMLTSRRLSRLIAR